MSNDFNNDDQDAFSRAFADVDSPPLVLPDPSDEEPGMLWDLHPSQTHLKDPIVGALRSVFDPEIPQSVYDLGLIYRVAADEQGRLTVNFTLTSPNCPEAEALPGMIERALLGLSEVPDDGVELRLTWQPEWTPERMPDSTKFALNMI